MNYTSPLTNSQNTKNIFEQQPLPIFQNKIYSTVFDAINVLKRSVTLTQCLDTGFVFSGGFDMTILEYDENYQNEQANSIYFTSHLNNIISILEKRNLLNGKVLEIGCGKGFFLDLLLQKEVDIIGIDPTYEGQSTKIIKDYYGNKYNHLNADLIILRHTLEHIPEPFEFLKMIAEANKYKGHIYIEIPTFDWIVNNNAIEDIFFEHCNYFTPKTFNTIFNNCDINYVFNNQYLGIIADMSSINSIIKVQTDIESHKLNFWDKLNHYKNLIKTNNNIAIWGAGAKGSTFLNLADPENKYVKCVIDINPKKQNKFIGGTGHKIISPQLIHTYKINTIIVMNSNYIHEISKMLDTNLIKLITI